MTGVIPDASEVTCLEAIVNKTAPQSLVLCLYTNNITPAHGDVVASYTEASGSGYSSFALTPANWVSTPGAPSSIAYPSHQFTFSGALGNVYGYFVKQTTSGKLVFAERFSDGPYLITGSGTPLTVTVTLTLGSLIGD